MRVFLRQLRPALLALVVFTVVCGVVYPLVVTAVAQVAFSDRANGSLVKVNGVVVGSSLIGQQFTSPKYFHPRPSAAGTGYDAGASSGSNLGPHNPTLLQSITDRVAEFRKENGLSSDVAVPVDAVTASGSGLDPEISVANARLQVHRVATTRGLTDAAVLALVSAATEHRRLAVLGDPGVNVLQLNIALDRTAS